MAVENKYVTTNFANGELLDSHVNGGSELVPYVVTFEVAAADDNGSIYRLFRINSSDVIYSLELSNDAITGGSDYDIGLYDITTDGAVVDKDVFADGISVASAGDKTNVLTAPDIAELNLPVWDLVSGVTENPQKQYDVAITANTVGSAAGTITVHALVAKKG
ncbi:MAG: hypothetical protein MI745_14065 [Pseudomonadales bacterium]|nr:hypothetical protein [Pseudomonadales bacterium]